VDRTRIRTALLAAPLLGLALTACGGGGGGAAGGRAGASPSPAVASSAAASPAGALAKPDYVTRAEAICGKAQADVASIPAPKDAAAFGSYLDSTIQVAGRSVTDLQALQPPAADAAELKSKFTEPLAAQVTAIREVLPKVKAAAASSDPSAAVKALEQPNAPRADSTFLSGYGLPTCAKYAGGARDAG